MNQGDIVQKIYEVSYQAAHNYFSDQLVIFSVIVATMVGLQFYWSYRISTDKIKEEVEKRVKLAEQKLIDDYKKRFDLLVEIASNSEKDLNQQNKSLQADIYRTMGHFFDSEKSFSVSFIWWIRAALNYSLVQDEKLVRITLNNAVKSAENIKYKFEIENNMGEFQEVMSLLDDSKYKLEKELLQEVVKSIFHKNQLKDE